MRHPMAGALCTEMKRGQVRTRAVIKSRSAGEAQSWCGVWAPRCSAPRPGLRLCPGVPRAWCPSHRALSSPCSPPRCPCANHRGRKTLTGCGAPDGCAVPGCALAVPAVGHWGTAQGGQAAAPAVGRGPGVCRVSLTPSCR